MCVMSITVLKLIFINVPSLKQYMDIGIHIHGL